MREIKFRVFYKPENMMIEWESLKHMLDDYIEPFAIRDDWKVMQSIGARDVNYKDIYEGDLVRFNHREGYSEVFEVVYLDEDNEDKYPTNPLMCCYILFNRKTKNWMDLQWDDTEDMEVIGNIYEHSNLLESENNNEK